VYRRHTNRLVFNLIVFHFPGAYGPGCRVSLGYLFGRSFESLMKESRRHGSGTWAVLLLLTLHGIMNFPPLTQAMQPDFNRMAAKQLEPRWCDPATAPRQQLLSAFHHAPAGAHRTQKEDS